jgi:hypothetical protein
MPNTLYTTLYDEVLPEFPALVQAMALNAIKQAAIEFCDRAWVWVVDQGPIAVAPQANTYDWEPPTGTEAARPIRVWLNKMPLTPKTAGELSELYGDYMQALGNPSFFVQDRPDQLIIVPAPTMIPAVGITAKLAVRPTQAATGLETWIMNKYRDAIAHGAKARLFRIPKKPWTDAAAAQGYHSMFEAAVAKAQLDAVRGFAGAKARTKPQFM